MKQQFVHACTKAVENVGKKLVQWLGWELNDQSSILGRAREGIFSLRHSIQTGSGAHPVSYPMDIEDSFRGSIAA
jgi:hypothetical protein